MSNSMQPTLDLLHGFINSTHTSNLTPYYPPANLPTPYPLVLFSVLISLTISCYSCKSAMISASALKNTVSGVRDHPKSPWARKPSVHETAIHETELEDLHKEDMHVRPGFDAPPPYMSEAGSTFEEPVREHQPEVMTTIAEEDGTQGLAKERERNSEWPESRSRQIWGSIFISYSTYRAVVAFIVNVQGLIDNHTGASAPSNLLILLVSIQILAANYSIPRILRGLLTIDIVLVSVAFVITSFASFSKGKKYPSYGMLIAAGGTCPYYASNCKWQTTHWDMVGCGNYTQLVDGDDDAPAPKGFFDPYVTSGNLNTKMNPLATVEAIILVGGLAWLLTAMFQVYEARYLIWERGEESKRRCTRNRKESLYSCGVGLMGCTALLGIIGAVIATLMSIGGHMSQALTPHYSVYMDSIGPAVAVNGTTDVGTIGNVYYTSVDYWGNATSWTDCFTLTSPTSGNGFWSEWVEWNRRCIYRVAAGV